MLHPLHGGKAAMHKRAVSNCQSSGRKGSTMRSVGVQRQVQHGSTQHAQARLASVCRSKGADRCSPPLHAASGQHQILHNISDEDARRCHTRQPACTSPQPSATRMQVRLLKFRSIASQSALCAPDMALLIPRR